MVKDDKKFSKLAQITAEKELMETAFRREQALATMKDFVQKHPHLRDVRSDDNFLLRFLRVRKFNIPLAGQNLFKYLNFRQTVPHFSLNLDWKEDKVAQLINSGYIFASPIRDNYGRRVVLVIAEKLDPFKYTKVEMAKAHLITYETLLEDEENQVMGLTHLADIKGLSMSHVSMWPPREIGFCIKVGESAIPLRHKAIHVFNLNPSFKFLLDFACAKASEKVRNRLMFPQSLEDLYKEIPKECLPKEYGGNMPMAEMIEMWKSELEGSRSRLLGLDSMKVSVTVKQQANFEEIGGSFRKLEID